MRISFSWLNEYLQLKDTADIATYADKLNETLTEVDGIETVTPKFSGVYVGKILHLKIHPNADSLQIATVDIGKQKLSIVCGATNIYEGMIVPVTIPGSILYDNNKKVVIKESTLRGEVSEGMMCSPKELGISKDHAGILDLSFDKNLSIGMLLDPIFTDNVLKIENKAITRRPDCFSHLGIAKELSAISIKKPISYLHLDKDVLSLSVQKIDAQVSMHTNATFAAKNPLQITIQGHTIRYTALTIEGMKVKPSPAHIQARLIAVGLRPINNIVDLTNYVMFDIGQPLHAFDLDYTGDRYVIRTAKKGEKITTLDNEEHILDEQDITITDGKKPLDIGGIIGGKESGVTEKTKRVVLVADNFDPAMLRRTSWRHGIRTDAVTIYEKGIDPNLTLKGIAAFINLYKEWYPEDMIVVSEIYDYYPDPKPEEKIIQVKTQDITDLIGVDIPKTTIKQNLALLGIKILQEEQGTLTLSIPSERQDLNIKEDIIEEVIRIYGYANLHVRPYYSKLRHVHAYIGRSAELEARSYLIDNGFYEIEPYAFAFSKEEDFLGFTGEKVRIKNPITIETDIMKSSLVPELLRAIKGNARFYDECKLYNLSRVFARDDNAAVLERKFLGGAVYKKGGKKHIEESFYEVKAYIIGIFERLHIPQQLISYVTSTNINETVFAKEASVSIYLGGAYAGFIGIAKKHIANTYDVPNPFIVFELDWQCLLEHIDTDKKLKPYSLLPSITSDISFYIDTKVLAANILDLLTTIDIKNLVSYEIIDEFIKSAGIKSFTIRFTFNNPKKTLTSAIVEKEIEKIKEQLLQTFAQKNITLR